MSLTVGGNDAALTVSTNATGTTYTGSNFSSSDEDVATVSMTGGSVKVHPVGAGSATITLLLQGNALHNYQYYKATCTVSVTSED